MSGGGVCRGGVDVCCRQIPRPCILEPCPLIPLGVGAAGRVDRLRPNPEPPEHTAKLFRRERLAVAIVRPWALGISRQIRKQVLRFYLLQIKDDVPLLIPPPERI